MAHRIITIDGPAASGKSTVARHLARHLNCPFLDTGAMYRTVSLACIQTGIDGNDESAILQVMETHTFNFIPAQDQMLAVLDDKDVSEAIRAPEVTAQVRYIAQAPNVRRKLVDMQRSFADQHECLVTEGRDQGTVAFPLAILKIFLLADPAERARRRHLELQTKGHHENLESVAKDVDLRDQSDQQRSVGPLTPAPDAITIDTTGLTPDEVVHIILTHLHEKGHARSKS